MKQINGTAQAILATAVAQARKLVTARTSGAAMAFAPNEGAGRFPDERYSEDNASNVGTLFHNLSEVFAKATDMGSFTLYYALPRFLTLEFQQERGQNFDWDYTYSQRTRDKVEDMTNRKRAQLFDQVYNQGFNFNILPLEGKRAAVSVSINPDRLNLNRVLSSAGIYRTHGALGEEHTRQLIEKLTSKGVKIGQRSEIKLPLELCYPPIFGPEADAKRAADGLDPHPLTRLKNSYVTVTLTPPASATPLIDPQTYQRIEYRSMEEIENPLHRVAFFWQAASETAISVTLTIEFEADEIQHLTQTEIEKSSIIDLADWVAQAVQGGMTSKSGGYSTFVTPLKVVRELDAQHNQGRKATPRTGVLGLMIKPSTLALVKMPLDADNIDQHYEDVASVHMVDGRYQHVVRNVGTNGVEGAIKSPGDRVITIDWNANILTLCQHGRTNYVDINDWGPATTWHCRRMIDDNSADYVLTTAYVTVSRAWNLLKSQGIVTEDWVKEQEFMQPFKEGLDTWNYDYYAKEIVSRGYMGNLKRLTDTLLGIKDRLPYKDEIHDNEYTSDPLMKRLFKFRFMNDQAPVPMIAFCGKILQLAYDLAARMDDTVLSKAMSLGIENTLIFRATIEVWHTYCRTPEAYAQLKTDDMESRAAYGRQPEDQDDLPPGYVPPPLPNIVEGYAVMPHQAKGSYSLERNPRFAVLDVDAGGGKTHMILTDVLRKLRNNAIDRPAVFCPSHLLSNYVQDGNYVTAGTINVVPINSTTVDNFGKEYFEKLAASCPPNTLFIVDYDFLKWDPQWISYGTMMEEVFGNAQWVRSLGFDAVWLDESHYLKNDSGRTHAARQALVDTVYRVLATGTMLATKIGDVVNQMMLLDPGVFGTEERFADKYGADGSSVSKAFDFETNQEIDLKAWMALNMQANSCVVKGRRKEWAALLPRKHVNFHWVELTEAQRKVYEAILASTLEDIQSDPKLMQLIEQQNEDFADQLDAMLQRYLQRIERFLTAPGADELSVALTANEAISPKGRLIGQIAKQHFAAKVPGKILVFTSYIESAKAVYEALPPDVKQHAMIYTAERKMQCREEFEKNPDIWMMIGVEQSMNTGINAQFCSRLIRVESVYSPGMLEQGESRVNRPNVKSEEFRTAIYLDWVLVDESIDVTKSGRLMWRSIDAAKFYNPNNPAYQDLADLSPLRMTIDSIMENNSFNEVLPEYIDAYLTLENDVKAGEIEEYKKRHPTLSFVPQATMGPLKGSALLKQVPYVPGGDLYNQADLGLIPVPEFERMNGRDALKDMNVHTDQGDGVIKRINKDTIRVKIGSTDYTLNKGTCFIISKTVTSAKEIRNALAKQADLPAVDVNRLGGIKQLPVEPMAPAPAIEKPAAPVIEPEEEDDDVERSTEAPEGKLLMQVRNNAEGGDWFDLTMVKDDKRGLPLDQQQTTYENYIVDRLTKYTDKESLAFKDCDARLIDSEGLVLFSTDGEDDWDEMNQSTEPDAEEDEVDQDGDTRGEDSPVPDIVEDGMINMTPCFYNEFFALIVNAGDHDLDKLGVDLTDFGFKPSSQSGYMHLKRWQHARDLGVALQASGLKVAPAFYDQLEQIQAALKVGRTHFQQYRHLNTSMADLQLFNLQRRKKLPAGQVQPYFTICDGAFFVMVDINQTPAWTTLKSKVRVSGAKWEVDDASLVFLADNKNKVIAAFKSVAKQYPVADIDWVKEELSKMSTAARKAELK